MSGLSACPNGLDALEARLRQDLAWLGLPAKAWVPPRIVDGHRVVDVVIIGAGMAGLVASAMPKRLGVANHVVLDKAPAGREGPWVTFARMRTLRSPKELTGPAMGLPALTFRAYYEALHGRDAWAALDKTPPPRASVLRVGAFPQARLHLASPITALTQEGDHLLVTTPEGRHPVDFLIFGTGFKIDPANRPELAAVASHIRFWHDRVPVPADMRNGELEASPDLGEAFEFLEAVPGACPALAKIHCFNFAATLSHGKLTGDIPAISEGADRLVRGIARALFVAGRERHFADLEAFETPELLGDEWADAPLHPDDRDLRNVSHPQGHRL